MLGLIDALRTATIALSPLAGALTAAAGAAALAGTLVVLGLRRADRRREAWAQQALHTLGNRGERVTVDRRHHLRGLLGGRPGVVTSTLAGRAVIALALFVPQPDVDPSVRPTLRLPRAPRGHRVGHRMVQLWQDRLDPAGITSLLTEGLALARALEAQALAPWAGFAAAHGLRFRPNQGAEPCTIDGEVDGVAVHLHLEGLADGPIRTILTASAPRPGGQRRPPPRLGPGRRPLLGALGTQPLSPATLARLDRHPDAQTEDDAVQLKIEGMLTDGLDAVVDDIVQLARLTSGQHSARGARKSAPTMFSD